MSSYAYELLMKDMRIDDRKFEDFRKIEIETGVAAKAEGSARVRLGDTEVIAGVKLNLGEPFADTPDEGILIVNVEFTPLASPDFESGPPGEDAVELARVVDRGLRESETIDLSKLCIKPKEKVWCVFIDIHIINHQGNLLDAAALASIAALHDAKMPKLKNEEIIRTEYEGKLPVRYKPANVTVCKVGNKFLLDPNFDEEQVVDAKLSISVRDDDKICALQKQGLHPIDIADVEKMFDIAIKKSKEIRKLIK
jgi:exosome complex component RRP42